MCQGPQQGPKFPPRSWSGCGASSRYLCLSRPQFSHLKCGLETPHLSRAGLSLEESMQGSPGAQRGNTSVPGALCHTRNPVSNCLHWGPRAVGRQSLKGPSEWTLQLPWSLPQLLTACDLLPGGSGSVYISPEAPRFSLRFGRGGKIGLAWGVREPWSRPYHRLGQG